MTINLRLDEMKNYLRSVCIEPGDEVRNIEKLRKPKSLMVCSKVKLNLHCFSLPYTGQNPLDHCLVSNTLTVD